MLAWEEFLREGEQVQSSRRGIALHSLPRPWDQVAVFLKKYITYEGRYQTVYNSDLPLLSHLCHGILLNIPYYLLHALRHMVAYVQGAKHQHVSLTHHGLIKLFISRTLAQHNIIWDQFIAVHTAPTQEPAPLLDAPVEQAYLQPRQEDQSPSHIVGGGILHQKKSNRGHKKDHKGRVLIKTVGKAQTKG